MRSAGKFKQRYRDQRGVSLVVVVFSMMILAVLGWTLANFIAGDFEGNLRSLESEQAFSIADAGIQEALMRLALGDQSFDTDTDFLKRSMAGGEYNVTRQADGTEVNVTSRGFVPSEGAYRALRVLSILVIPSGLLGVSAFTGGYLFDWHYTRGYTITVDGVIGAAHYEGSDLNIIQDQNATQTTPSDFAVPGSEDRIQGAGDLPAIDMDNLRYIADHSPPGMKAQHLYGDQTFYGNNNNLGFIFVEGNVTLDTDRDKKGVDFSHANIIATGNITITGTGPVSVKAHVQPNGKSYPVLATQYGNITSSAPSGYQASSRTFEGLIYSQYGTVDINCIKGNSIMGYIVRLRGNIDLDYDAKRIDMDNGFTEVGGTTIHAWQEK